MDENGGEKMEMKNRTETKRMSERTDGRKNRGMKNLPKNDCEIDDEESHKKRTHFSIKLLKFLDQYLKHQAHLGHFKCLLLSNNLMHDNQTLPKYELRHVFVFFL